MNYIPHVNEKDKDGVRFQTWSGHLAVAVPCGGWRRIRPLDLALMPLVTRRLVLIRDMEG